jgi:selenocysteine-specific translation elongation factor
MHIVTKEVKTAGKVVENLSIENFDTLDELIAAVKPEQIVAYYNTQKTENERNIARAKHQPDKASKEKKMKLAFQLAFTMFKDELTEAVSKGTEAVDALLNSEKVQKAVEDTLTAAA